MTYLGGKAKIGARIAAALNVDPRCAYVEPFCGMLGVLRHVSARKRYAFDARPEVIAYWRAVQAGWRPPAAITEREYDRLRAANDADDPRTAWAAYGCSFAGKRWGGLARSAASHDHGAVRREAERVGPTLGGVDFGVGDYRALSPTARAVVYCDPPYAATTGYPDVGAFDSDAFWNVAREWAANGAAVFVSEFTAPHDAELVWSVERRITASGGHGPVAKVDTLYRLRSAP